MKDTGILMTASGVRKLLDAVNDIWALEHLTAAERATVLDVRKGLERAKRIRHHQVRVHPAVLRDAVDLFLHHLWHHQDE